MAHFVTMSVFFILLQSTLGSAQEIKGLLPEIRTTNDSADETDKKSLASELMISKSEEKAIQTLIKIIQKNKGADHEAELHNRLAELYMRRSKSGRFFDLNRENSNAQKALQLFPVAVKGGKEYVKRAIEVYDLILKKFKNYRNTDTVLFENAFAHAQVNQTKRSLELYQTIVKNFPASKYLPEAIMAMGELYYNDGKFKECLSEISKLDNFKDSKVYLYGMYKSAWAHYNLKNSTDSVDKLLIVAKSESTVYSLRKEALKDLILFTSDFYQADQMYSFFKKHVTDEEMNWIVTDLTQLYQGYSRYLDANLIIQQYQRDYPLSSIAVGLEMSLAENFEWLKKRPDVLEHLELAQKYCQPKSDWAVANTQENYQESCNTKLKSFQAELTTKWWEIWEKNKKHKEFNDLLIALLRIGLMNEDSAETDKKTRYLLAEILFHNEQFEEASKQYQIVADKSQESQLRHDSYYSALFSFEKYLGSPTFTQQMSKKDVQDRVYVLAQQYLTFSPQGVHHQQVRLKLASIATEKKDYPEALKYLAEIKETKDQELLLKCQDLQLEIYNIQKDFKSLKNFATNLLTLQHTVTTIERKNHLTQISKEAEFNEILESKDREKLLLAFSEANRDIKLGQEALWKVVSENYKNKKLMTAAELSELYASRYPQDERSQSALSEALNVYIRYGYFAKSIEVIAQIKTETSKKDYAERLGDYYRIENNYVKASDKYLPALEKAKPGTEDFQRLFEKVKVLSEKDSRVQLNKIYSVLIQNKVEPYLSRHQTEKAEALFSGGKYSEAFDATKKIMSKSIPIEEKFESRMIQAKVLEHEFISQSLKTSPSKLSLVLAIKTEKFDKAHTSFNDALKMTQDPRRQKLALLGIQRSFDHFATSIENIPLSDELSEEEKKAVKSELTKLIEPLKERRAENEAKIAEASGLKEAASKDTAQSMVIYQEIGRQLQWPLILPRDAAMNGIGQIQEKTALKSESIKLLLDDPMNEKLNLFQLALFAVQENKNEKARYLLTQIQDPASTKSLNPFVRYLTGYSYQKDQSYDLAYQHFSRSYAEFESVQEFNKISKIEEFAVLKILKSHALQDYLTVLETFSGLRKYHSNHIKLTQIYVDSLIGTGQSDKAMKYLQSAIKKEKDVSLVEFLNDRLLALQNMQPPAADRSVPKENNPGGLDENIHGRINCIVSFFDWHNCPCSGKENESAQNPGSELQRDEP